MICVINGLNWKYLRILCAINVSILRCGYGGYGRARQDRAGRKLLINKSPGCQAMGQRGGEKSNAKRPTSRVIHRDWFGVSFMRVYY